MCDELVLFSASYTVYVRLQPSLIASPRLLSCAANGIILIEHQVLELRSEPLLRDTLWERDSSCKINWNNSKELLKKCWPSELFLELCRDIP